MSQGVASPSSAPPAMSQADFAFVSELLKTRSGLALTPDKMYLLESRLLPIARVRGLAGLGELVAQLRNRPVDTLVTEVVEAMTTNESLFFRDGKPFDQMRLKLFPELRRLAEARKLLRIWSAACSTGQEPYSVAMTLLEDAAGSAGWRHEIVATDLAQKVIDKAKAGVYSQFEAQRGLPIQLLLKYFSPMSDTSWQAKESLRGMIDFKPQNLLEDFGRLGKFDFILCRNVLIYFDEPTKVQIVRRMCGVLNPGGILMLGGTEAILDTSLPLAPVEDCRGTYRLK